MTVQVTPFVAYTLYINHDEKFSPRGAMKPPKLLLPCISTITVDVFKIIITIYIISKKDCIRTGGNRIRFNWRIYIMTFRTAKQDLVMLVLHDRCGHSVISPGTDITT